jgi:hypothetical protein
MDSCLMQENGISKSLTDVAKNVVASEEVEAITGPHSDGQHAENWLKDVFQHPEMSGKDLSRDIVESERENSRNTEEYHDGAPPLLEKKPINTISALDLTKYPDFSKALDTFADTLKDSVVSDPANKAALEKVIAGTPHFDRNSTRDLKYLTDKLEAAITSGEYSDKDGKLKGAIDNLQEKEKGLVTDSYGNKMVPHYDEFGGLSIYMSESAANLKEDGTELGMFKKIADSGEISSRDKVVGRMNAALKGMGFELKAAHYQPSESESREVEQLGNDIKKLGENKNATDEQFKEQCNQIVVDASHLYGTPLAASVLTQCQASLGAQRKKEAAAHLTYDGKEWGDLLNALL